MKDKKEFIEDELNHLDDDYVEAGEHLSSKIYSSYLEQVKQTNHPKTFFKRILISASAFVVIIIVGLVVLINNNLSRKESSHDRNYVEEPQSPGDFIMDDFTNDYNTIQKTNNHNPKKVYRDKLFTISLADGDQPSVACRFSTINIDDFNELMITTNYDFINYTIYDENKYSIQKVDNSITIKPQSIDGSNICFDLLFNEDFESYDDLTITFIFNGVIITYSINQQLYK